jgi:hypothetical protein
MSVFTLVKLGAALIVVVVLGGTSMLAWHVAIEPLGGLFEKLIPANAILRNQQDEHQIVRTLKSKQAPDVDPAAQSFAKARDVLAMGKVSEARERFAAIIHGFPSSPTAPLARQIVGGMNLDDLLSTRVMDGKAPYRVVPGDSYLGLIARQQTTLENLIHINALMEMKAIRPGDELVVMPLHFRMLIEPRRRMLSLWDGGKFLCEFALCEVPSAVMHATGTTTVRSKSAEVSGQKIAPGSKGYAAATKVISLKNPAVRIMSGEGEGEDAPVAIVLKAADMEELNLLVREGNTVEFR